ncbi:Metallo-dependent phosphatase-like protein [Phlyctochytrium arcticum]|nr:Metallo-dependent phosphatase-like protein [Phlyctochytrium arcticum]
MGLTIVYLFTCILAVLNVVKAAPVIASPQRIVAIGDLHGDFPAALDVLRMAGVIDANGEWNGGDTVLVQTGDIVDRGTDTIKLYNLFGNLTMQAPATGGKVVQLLGNHEIMNMSEDLRYVTKEDIDTFGSMEARKEAWSRDGWLGNRLRNLDIIDMVNGTVFVHGGISPTYAKKGIQAMNAEARKAYQLDPPKMDQIELFGDEGPLWYRGFALDAEPAICTGLDQSLEALNATRMVIGHTPQDESRKILSRCQNKVLVIDMGISAAYGSNRAVLQILRDELTGIYKDGLKEVINNVASKPY